MDLVKAVASGNVTASYHWDDLRSEIINAITGMTEGKALSAAAKESLEFIQSSLQTFDGYSYNP